MVVRYAYLLWLRQRLRRFLADAKDCRAIQHRALMRKIRRHQSSAFGQDYGFGEMRTADDFRNRLPILSYEDHHPYMQRVLAGEISALFHPQTHILMFAMTSGTTGEPKRIPITKELFREYRLGWRLWGGGVYGDHWRLMSKKTLQLTSDWQQYRAPSGTPCGQISGLAATTRPRIAQIMFMPPPETSKIHDASAKHYTALRLALASTKIGMIITANPSTLVEIAHRADREAESLIRDIHDGTLSCQTPPSVATALAGSWRRRNPRRARALEQLVERRGKLLPKDAWPDLSMIAVWTGGCVGVFLPQLAELYGETAIRDHGLSASEGRMTIPLADNTSAGILDFYNHYFEFVPVDERDSAQPTVLEAHELEEGRDYFIIMTTSGGLYRYDIHDVVRCVGYEGQAPLLAFLNKGKSFSNLTGEKLSEHQVVRAVEDSFRDLQIPIAAFTLAPVLGDSPRYVLLLEQGVPRGQGAELAARVQMRLEQQNEEYASKCASQRLLPIEAREVPRGAWRALRHEKTSQRGNFEEYKQPCLVSDVEFADRIAGQQRERPPLPTSLWTECELPKLAESAPVR